MSSKVQRLISVDFLRGITVAGMIMVNNPGSWEYIYSPLEHASWNGCTPTDLIFPFFLFLVGFSINLSLAGYLQSGKPVKELYGKILKRTVILFSLGLLIAAFPFTLDNLLHIRIPGVLQRIAVVFLICSFIFVTASKKNQYIISIGLLLFYWGIMTLVPVPGVGEANLGRDTNIGAWLDRLLLDGHLWAIAKTWDPEGILSTVPAIVSGMIGIFAADILKQKKTPSSIINNMALTGGTLILIGLLWGIVFPINKSLWTSSYVCFTGGIAMIAFSIAYYMIDVKEYKNGIQPFLYFGTNAITLYVGSELLAKTVYLITFDTKENQVITLKSWLFEVVNGPVIGPYNASLILALIWVITFGVIAWLMFRNRIFIKV